MLNLLIKFRLEYLYPIVLLIQEVHNLWKCSTLSRYLTRNMTILPVLANPGNKIKNRIRISILICRLNGQNV